MKIKTGQTILLVEDDAIINASQAQTLKKYGYTVITAMTAQEAVNAAHTLDTIDLILMDIDLGPGQDGTQAAEAILKTRDIPVLFLSSHTEPEIVDKTERITSYGYVVKNSGETVLIASIRMAFRLHEAYITLKKREEQLQKTLDERRIAEEALRKSENKLSLIFENTQNAITITELATGAVIDANNGISWTGWARDEIIGKTPGMLQCWVRPDESERIRDSIITSGRLTDYRVDIRKKDGSIAHALMNLAIIPMDGKEYLMSIANDVTRLIVSENALTRANENLEGTNEELNMTIEELESTNEELQTTVSDLEETKHELEQSLAERKLIEEAIRKSEEQYRTLFEKSATANIITATDTTILLANGNFEKLIGYSRHELEGRISWTQFVLDEYLEKMKSYHFQRRTDPDSPPQTYEFKGRVRSGSIRDFHMSVAMLPGTTDSVASIIDITERVQAEEALRQNEERFRHLAEFLPESVFETDLYARLTYANMVSLERFGISLRDLNADTFVVDMIAPQDRDRAARNMVKLLKGEKLGLNEYQAIRKDGTTFPALIHTTVIIRNGQPAGLRGFLVDITERKRAEQALRESEERWQFALEGSGDGVWDWDLQTNKVYYSHQWKAMLGYDDEEIGTNLAEWVSRVHPDDLERAQTDINRHLEGETPVYINEHRLMCKDGQYKWVLDRGKVMNRTDDGKPVRIIGTYTDITEIRRTSEALMHAIEEKESLLRELQHRIKNSLTMITSLIAIESNRPENAGSLKILDLLRGRIDSLANLYSILFKSGQTTSVNLGDYISAIIKSLTDTYVQEGSGISIEQSCVPLRTNTKNATAWGLIINELLTNALKYSFPQGGGGIIRISLTETNEMIDLRITDNGPGPGAGFDIGQSNGFGLLMVGMLTKQLRGTFAFEQGRDNAFVVRVPKTKGAAASS